VVKPSLILSQFSTPGFLYNLAKSFQAFGKADLKSTVSYLEGMITFSGLLFLS